MAEDAQTDFSSFMCVILMLTGCLVTIMISNIVIIAANPENVQITSIAPTVGDSVGAGDNQEEAVKDDQGNVTKNPWYLEVARDHLIIHPGEEIVNIKDLEGRDNGFERLLARVEERKEREYIVLLIRPYGAGVARQIKRAIVDRKIDVGMDLLQKDVPVKLKNVGTTETNQTAKVES